METIEIARKMKPVFRAKFPSLLTKLAPFLSFFSYVLVLLGDVESGDDDKDDELEPEDFSHVHCSFVFGYYFLVVCFARVLLGTVTSHRVTNHVLKTVSQR